MDLYVRFCQNLLKMLKKEHPSEDWQNCGMLYFDGDELVDTVNKVLSTYATEKYCATVTVKTQATKVVTKPNCLCTCWLVLKTVKK